MSTRHYLLPTAFAQSPQAADGNAVRLGGSMVWASQFTILTSHNGKIADRQFADVDSIKIKINSLSNDLQAQWENIQRFHPPLQLGSRTIRLDSPQVMGILNVTPDSFSDGGQFMDDPDVAQTHATSMVEAGAAIIDVGGESTRPGAAAVWEGDELKRVIPAIERLSAAGAAISVDSRRSAVMEASLKAGAHLVNDVSGLRHDPRSLAIVRDAGCPVVIMHAPGDGDDPHAEGGYENVLLDVFDWLAARRDALVAAGIAREKIILDPGIGFGKSLADNLALLNGLALFHALGQPLLVGASRKRMIGALSNEAPAHQRLGGSLLLAGRMFDAGIHLLRVHDVPETVQAMHIWRGLRDAAVTDFSLLN